MRVTLQQALTGTQELIAQATANMLELERRVNADALNLLYRAQCAAQETLTEGRRAFALMVEDVRLANPGITFLGLRLTGVRAESVEILDPDQAYRSVRDARLAQLRRTVNDRSAAYEIISTYANLQRMARLTLCHYLDQSVAGLWITEINDLERRTVPWTTVVRPRL